MQHLQHLQGRQEGCERRRYGGICLRGYLPSEINDFCSYPKDLERIAMGNYMDDVISRADCKFIATELQKHIDPLTPIVATSFDAFKYTPVYGYVHPTLATNRGETVTFMHLAVVVNILAHQPSFPLLNSQSAVSSLRPGFACSGQRSKLNVSTRRSKR